MKQPSKSTININRFKLEDFYIKPCEKLDSVRNDVRCYVIRISIGRVLCKRLLPELVSTNNLLFTQQPHQQQHRIRNELDLISHLLERSAPGLGLLGGLWIRQQPIRLKVDTVQRKKERAENIRTQQNRQITMFECLLVSPLWTCSVFTWEWDT